MYESICASEAFTILGCSIAGERMGIAGVCTQGRSGHCRALRPSPPRHKYKSPPRQKYINANYSKLVYPISPLYHLDSVKNTNYSKRRARSRQCHKYTLYRLQHNPDTTNMTRCYAYNGWEINIIRNDKFVVV